MRENQEVEADGDCGGTREGVFMRAGKTGNLGLTQSMLRSAKEISLSKFKELTFSTFRP